MNKWDIDAVQYYVTKEGETYAKYQKQETNNLYKGVGVKKMKPVKTSSGRRG